jgi:hypothetical protein
LEEGKIEAIPPENDVVELRILDYDNTGVGIERVQIFFAGVNALHTQLTMILGINDSQLKVAYVDSGTDLYSGFQCAKAVAEIMRGLFGEFWEKFKYSRYEDFNKKIDSLSNGLSFVGAVKEQVEKKALSDEDARNLTHRVLQEMATLVGIGASLPQDQYTRPIDARKELLELRGVRLLGDGNEPEKPAINRVDVQKERDDLG